MKLLTAIIFGLSLIGSASYAHSGGTNSQGCHTDHSNNQYHCHKKSSAKLSININIGPTHAHGGNVCTIRQTNVSGALDTKISWGFKSNGNLYVDDGYIHEFDKRMVKETNSRIVIKHSNGSVIISKVQSWMKVSWYQNGVEKYVKGLCK